MTKPEHGRQFRLGGPRFCFDLKALQRSEARRRRCRLGQDQTSAARACNASAPAAGITAIGRQSPGLSVRLDIICGPSATHAEKHLLVQPDATRRPDVPKRFTGRKAGDPSCLSAEFRIRSTQNRGKHVVMIDQMGSWSKSSYSGLQTPHAGRTACRSSWLTTPLPSMSATHWSHNPQPLMTTSRSSIPIC
jgi:hypothetical protein